MAEKLVIHQLHPGEKTFTDITAKVGDVNKLAAGELAKKLAEYAKTNKLSLSHIVSEVVAS